MAQIHYLQRWCPGSDDIMAIDLTDAELDALAERARKVLNAPSKQDAVRQALEKVVASEGMHKTPSTTPSRPLDERLQRLREKYNLPPYESLEPFDDKAFLDDMWGENDVHR
jgi:antitoxin VapB